MSLNEVDNLGKTFSVPVRRGGRFGAVKTLLAREYRRVSAVDGVSFQVAAGEMVGYVGPNGAGKSTTIKMLTGILVPSGGRITVDGACRIRSMSHTSGGSGWCSASAPSW
jgi:ABC-2 type transport system ATP-binding protein